MIFSVRFKYLDMLNYMLEKMYCLEFGEVNRQIFLLVTSWPKGLLFNVNINIIVNDPKYGQKR